LAGVSERKKVGGVIGCGAGAGEDETIYNSETVTWLGSLVNVKRKQRENSFQRSVWSWRLLA